MRMFLSLSGFYSYSFHSLLLEPLNCSGSPLYLIRGGRFYSIVFTVAPTVFALHTPTSDSLFIQLYEF